jgi:C4-dicarboxylate transporter, DctM subunit
VIAVLGLLLLAAIGTPLFVLLGATALSLSLGMPGGEAAAAAAGVFGIRFGENPTLAAIPLFMVAGCLLAEAGTVRRLDRVATAWLGWMPRGQRRACVSGFVAARGPFGLLFPLSVPLVLYGVTASLAMPALLLAGLLPGLLAIALLAGLSARSSVARVPFAPREALASLWHGKWELAIPIGLLAVLASGLLRVHEAAALLVVYVLAIETRVYRDLDLARDLPRVAIRALALAGAVLIVLGTAIGFDAWLAQVEAAAVLASWAQRLAAERVFLVALSMVSIGAGMVLGVFTAIAVVVPLIVPAAFVYAVDPNQLAVVVLLSLELGRLAQPYGWRWLGIAPDSDATFEPAHRAARPVIAVLSLALLLSILAPVLSTWLPSRIR